ncbi:hypothetical protein [Mannheimia granulomatis]|uniref:hypothetical protein n=1 Tax=Mannheimia granulomatis TaxID=85402 RepID=UPI00067DE81D|nr:hypothetical protein [Mannheimia granulomatis]QLB19914.1 hypothetical protein A6B41_10880 [Mannheimia granulomatis]
MSKQYHFDIDYLDTRYNQRGRGAVTATSILDAKNRFKSSHPTCKILACVRGAEITSSKNAIKQELSRKKADKKEDSSSLTSSLIGAAVGVGISWLLKKK